MKYRKSLVLFMIFLLPVCISAFQFAGGGSYLIYKSFDFSEINTLLEAQNFPILREHGFGTGGKGYGVFGKGFIIGGEGYSVKIKESNENKSSTVVVGAGGLYLGKQVDISERVKIKLGGTIGSYSKTLTLYEKTNDPFIKRDHSILKQNNVLLRPQLDVSFSISPLITIEIGVGQSFSVKRDADNLDAIKTNSVPEISLFFLSFIAK